MALNINGTTGISGVDGSASAPALQGTDSNTGINFGSDTVNINTGGSTRATIDSTGALNVPTTFPIKVNGSEKLKIDSSGRIGQYAPNFSAFNANADDFIINGSGNTGITINSGAALSTSEGNLVFAEGNGSGGSSDAYRGAIKYKHGDDYMAFYTDVSERMRIDSSGRMLVNTTSNFIGDSKFEVENGGGNVGGFYHNGSGNNYPLIIRNNRCDAGTTGTLIHFVKIGGSEIGSIRANGSSTSYLTSSDYRLKENVTAISDGITRLKTLKPSRFNFKADKDTTVDGFLSHEVTAVPEATTGTKDEVATEDSTNFKKGDPIYQTIDQSKLVPLLTAALQEAIAKIEVLETKVAALEAG